MASTDTGARRESASPLVVMEGVSKRFPGVLANDDVTIDLRKGEVHALIGENGAGKSTLMRVLYGLYPPDGGTIRVKGEVVKIASPRDAIALGIGMVHQHFVLVDPFTVAENIILGSEPTRGGLVDIGHARRRIRDIGRQYGLHIDPDIKVGDLSVGEQQRVELVKALYRDADILILDEPTAVLTPGEVDDFFAVVRSLVQQGKSIIFITHKLREVLAVADRITVLRGGKVAGSADPETATQQTLANLMVGRDVVFRVEKSPPQPRDVMLSIRDLHVLDDRGHPTVNGFTAEVRAGEVYGIAGVEGNGQRELVEALTGMRAKARGRVTIGGRDVTKMSPREISEIGTAHIPEDRGKHGLVSSYTIVDNVVLNRFSKAPFARRGVRDMDAAADEARRIVKDFDVRTPGVNVAAGTLSGGNQQKLIVGRELAGTVKVLFVAQPTRGLDVGSIEFIHKQIIAMRDSGAAVFLVSAELDEIMSLSDRIGVLYRGRIVGEFDGATATREELGFLMATGAAPDPAEPDAPPPAHPAQEANA